MIYPSTQSYYTTLLNLFVYLMKKATGLSFNEPVLPKVYFVAHFGGMSIKSRLGEKLEMHFTVPADRPDDPFTLDPITGGDDSEGNDIPASEFSLSDVTSSDDTVVSIVDVAGGGKALHYGVPGAALIQTQPMFRGAPFGSPITAEFAVTTGAPVSIIGGGFNIPGLTPDA